MTPDEIARYRALRQAQRGLSFVDFVHRNAPELGATVPRHLRPLYRLIEASRRRPVRAKVSMAPRSGKLVADSTPVLTPLGWRMHGDLAVGDEVYAPDGTTTRVVAVMPKDAASLAVRFSDGEVVRVHPDHEWRVYRRGKGWEVVETKEILRVGLTSGRQRNGAPRCRFFVAYASPLGGVEQPLPTDPYLFGLWLGDGTTACSRITASPGDAPFHMAEVRRRGYAIRAINRHRTTGCVTFAVRGLFPDRRVPQHRPPTPGMNRPKTIPDCYYTAAEEQRRDLLRGLVDSDGTVDKAGRVTFTNTNEQLARDVARLVATLGYRVGLYRRAGHSSTTIAACRATKDTFNVCWTPTDGKPQARLPRKNIRWLAQRRMRSIVSIEPCDPESGNCIQVDREDGMYLVGERLVPTHNSTTFRQATAWRLLRDPACLNFYVPGGDGLAVEFSYKTRRLARTAGVPLADDRKNVRHWSTIFDGGLKSVSLFGDLVGRGCNGGLIFCDDMLRGRDDAESKLKRDKIWDAFRDDVMSRVERGAGVIVCGTRWHEDDVHGRLARDPLGEQWEEFIIPAVVDPDGNPTDNITPECVPFWPEGGFDLAWARKALARGAYGFWSLYQQQPRPRGGKLFNEPARFRLEDFRLDEGWRLVLVLDPAGTAHTRSDYSAGGVLAMRGHGHETEGRVLVRFRVQEPLPAVMRRVQRIRSTYPLPLHIEAIGGFAAMPDMIRAIDPDLPVIPIRASRGDKFTRAQPLSAAWNDPSGRFAVPLGDGWDEYVDEFRDFSGVNDAHDDQVDWTAYAWTIGYRSEPAELHAPVVHEARWE